MKKDHLPIWPSDTNKGGAKSIEVFYLKNPIEYRVVDDAGCDVNSGKYVGGPPLELGELGELDVNENSAGEGAHSSYLCDMGPHEGKILDEEAFHEAFHEAIAAANKESAMSSCCPTGPIGEKGPRGYEEGNIYKLILGSLDKALPDAKESFREVVADGIAKKITKHMSGEE